MIQEIAFPNVRIEVTGATDIINPLFIQDITNANQSLFTFINKVYGLAQSGTTAFAIISGFDYDVSLHSYAPGIVYMNGDFYYMPDTLLEGKYLQPNIQTGYTVKCGDGLDKDVYKFYYCQSSDVQVDDMPIFANTMDEYRLTLSSLNTQISNTVKGLLEPFGETAIILSGCVLTGSVISEGFIYWAGIIYYVPAQTASGTLTPVISFYKASFNTLLAHYVPSSSIPVTDLTYNAYGNYEILKYSDLIVFKSDSANYTKTKIVSFSGWNMLTTDSISIAHGLSVTNIAGIQAFATDNSGHRQVINGDGWGSFYWDASNVFLFRTDSGYFQTASFNNASGFILIHYI